MYFQVVSRTKVYEVPICLLAFEGGSQLLYPHSLAYGLLPLSSKTLMAGQVLLTL